LSWRSGRLDARVDQRSVDAIAVSDQIRGYEVRADGSHDLLRGPRGVGVRRHVNVQDTAALEREDEEKT
jgi:hypothetical protein